MNKKAMYIGVICVLIIAVIVTLFLVYDRGEDVPEDQIITIRLWEFDLVDAVMDRTLVNEVEITNRNDVNFLRTILEEAEDLQTSIAISAEVEIDFNDGYMIFFGINNPGEYAFVQNLEQGISKIIEMPEGLVEFVEEHIL